MAAATEEAEPPQVLERVGDADVGEDGQDVERVVEPVPVPHHAVAEAVGRGRELHRDERLRSPREELQLGPRLAGAGTDDEDVAQQLWAHQAGQEVVDHHPLVVPGHHPAGLVEQRSRVGGEAQAVDHRVVEPDEGQVELADDEVNVVAGITDQGPALLVAR